MKTKFQHGLTIFSQAFLSASLILLFLFGWINPALEENSGWLLISLCCAWMPLSLFSSVWLAWINRHYFSNIFIWLGFQILFILALFGSQVSYAPVVVLSASILFILFMLLGIVDFFYSYIHHYSLRFIAFGSISYIWSILFAWRIHGNLFDVWIFTLFNNNHELLWLNGAMILTVWMFFAGLACFLVETFQVLLCECTSQMP